MWPGFERAGLRRLVAAAALAATAEVFSPASLNVCAAPVAPRPSPRFHIDPAAFAEHRYRIGGKVRLAVVWAGRDDIGTARMTWRSDESGTSVALLAGSNPERAPRRLNQWGYVREEVHGEDAEVFIVRSELDESARHVPASVDQPLFAAGCASISGRDIRSFATKVNAPEATYRAVNRLLELLVASPPKWDEKRIARPSGVEPGFLTALHRLLQAAAADPLRASGFPAVAYLYKNTIYDLSIRRTRALGRTVVGTRTFEQLNRSDLVIRNRNTGDLTKFAVTYEPDGSRVCLPVQIIYQPNFWLAVELTLDEDAGAPPDPAADRALVDNIRQICAAAAH